MRQTHALLLHSPGICLMGGRAGRSGRRHVLASAGGRASAVRRFCSRLVLAGLRSVNDRVRRSARGRSGRDESAAGWPAVHDRRNCDGSRGVHWTVRRSSHGSFGWHCHRNAPNSAKDVVALNYRRVVSGKLGRPVQKRADAPAGSPPGTQGLPWPSKGSGGQGRRWQARCTRSHPLLSPGRPRGATQRAETRDGITPHCSRRPLLRSAAAAECETLIWLSLVKSPDLSCVHPCEPSPRIFVLVHRSSRRHDVLATVDAADIRGLATARLLCVAELPHPSHGHTRLAPTSLTSPRILHLITVPPRNSMPDDRPVWWLTRSRGAPRGQSPR
jgi:hypothetical protein